MQCPHLSHYLPGPTLIPFPQPIRTCSLTSQDKGLGVETFFPRDLETAGYTPVTFLLPKQTPDMIYKDKRFLLPLDLGVPVPSELSASPLDLLGKAAHHRGCVHGSETLCYSVAAKKREREETGVPQYPSKT